MRVKRKTDYETISRRSVERDFYSERIYLREKKTPENENSEEITKRRQTPVDGEVFRVASINMACEYMKYARFFVGKLVRRVRSSGIGETTTGWYEFVHDRDREALNQAAGWSENKREYLLERPKLK